MPKGIAQDLTGLKKGSIEVLKRVEDFEGESDTRAQYLIKCECGNIEKKVGRNIQRRMYPTCSKCPRKGLKKRKGSIYSEIMERDKNETNI